MVNLYKQLRVKMVLLTICVSGKHLGQPSQFLTIDKSCIWSGHTKSHAFKIKQKRGRTFENNDENKKIRNLYN